MRAVVVDAFGGPDALALRDVPVPGPGPGQVLVRVESASVNFSDVLRRRASPYPLPTALPFTPGGEVAGTVAALGPGVDGPAVGTPVFAVVGTGAMIGTGGYAQYATADAAQTVPIPPGLAPDVACGLVIAGATAVLALTESARLQPGETVLVEAAAGGVGSYAVQFARRLGAGVVIGAAGSEDKRRAALALGAHHAVDYTRPGWDAEVRALTGGRGVDVVLEMQGGDQFDAALRCLAPFGRAVVYGSASPEPRRLGQAALDALFADPALGQSLVALNIGAFFGLRPEAAGRAIQTLVAAVAAGEVAVTVGRVLPLAEARVAHELLEGRGSAGKLVLKPWADAWADA